MALASIGIIDAAIPVGAHREPRFPAGITGSITHSLQFRGAAVARTSQHASIGIDAEVHVPLPRGVLNLVALPGELAHGAMLPDGLHEDTILFSAKESVIKFWHGLTETLLSFQDVSISFIPDRDRPDRGSLVARIVGSVGIATTPDPVHGRYRVAGGYVFTAFTERDRER